MFCARSVPIQDRLVEALPPFLEVETDGVDEDLRHGPSVDMHLLILLAAGFNVYQDRRELARKRRRGKHQ